LATHKSALKRHRQSVKKNIINTAARTKLRNQVRAVLAAIEEHDKDKSAAELLKVIPALHQAAAKGVIHRNTASRNISRLTLKVNTLAAAAPVAATAKKPPKKKASRTKSAAK
jgi:small subunit ribosomal protein S20